MSYLNAEILSHKFNDSEQLVYTVRISGENLVEQTLDIRLAVDTISPITAANAIKIALDTFVDEYEYRNV